MAVLDFLFGKKALSEAAKQGGPPKPTTREVATNSPGSYDSLRRAAEIEGQKAAMAKSKFIGPPAQKDTAPLKKKSDGATIANLK